MLTVDAGHASDAGQRQRNEDFVGMVTPAGVDLRTKGVLAAIADGVSGNAGGREAAEYAVRGLLTDYFATPETWTVAQSLERVLKAINSWVQQQGSVRAEMAGMATTLTCLALRGNLYYYAHAGDTRLYLLRNGKLSRLTTDHVWDRPEMRHVLTRAIGLDSHLTLDHGMGSVHAGDVFLLASDGVWAAMPEYDIGVALEACAGGASAAECARELVGTALAAGSHDNASALVLRIDGLPVACAEDSLASNAGLAAPPRLQPGHIIDGMAVRELLHASAATLVYKVEDPASGRQLVLKTLHPSRANDAQERAAFAHEEWLARRVVARFFPQVISPAQQSYLYYLTTWHEGHTLQAALDADRHTTVPEAIAIGEQLVRAAGALHRRSVVHRDIKPANVHMGEDGQLRLLDLGVAQSGLSDSQAAPLAGTPSFLAPELFEKGAPGPQTDIYAAGVTLYHLLTRHYPYGEVEPFQRPRFGTPERPGRYRPDVPAWLENVLLKAVAKDPVERFETAEEFLLALERGASRPLPAPPIQPLLRRDPVGAWRAVAITAIVLNILLLYLLALRPG
jgi:protein phosphatase